MNPFKEMPFSSKYKEILESRQRLPVFNHLPQFYEMFQKSQIMVMVGETGSGKTTQIPQFVVYSDLPQIKKKVVACTQPHRVSAMSVAQRVADEMDVELGREVGYSIQFEDMTQPGT
ncbi:hypothetical protein EW146_g8313, partial [Bondarzewia mesenterica]